MTRFFPVSLAALIACGTPDPDDLLVVGTALDPTTDSDGDGYTDVEELHAGTDPDDAESVIYQGGWPYNPDKDALEDPGWDSTMAVGQLLPELVGVDQYGDLVSTYDFIDGRTPGFIVLASPW